MFIKKLRNKAATSVRPAVKLDKVVKVLHYLIVFLDPMSICPVLRNVFIVGKNIPRNLTLYLFLSRVCNFIHLYFHPFSIIVMSKLTCETKLATATKGHSKI